MTIPGTLKRWADKIEDVGRDPDGWSISLKDGWMCTETETHQIYENTLKEIAAKCASIVPCDCEDCRQGLAKTT